MIRFSVKHPVSITMLIGILLALGAISLGKLGVDFLPNIEYPSLSIITNYGHVAPEDVEELVTKPIEEAVSTVNRVKKVSSFSMEGVSFVNVEFEWGTNLDFAAQDVRDKIGLIEGFLPEDASKPIVFKFDMSQMPVIEYPITSDKYSEVQLKEIAKDNFKNVLERVDGVAQVQVFGGREKKYWVFVKLPKLVQYGLDIQSVVNLLRFNNFNLPVGKIDRGSKTLLIRTIGEYKSKDDLLNQVVGYTKAGNPVYLRDIADVKFSVEEPKGYMNWDGKNGIVLEVYKQSGSNTLNVARRVKKVIEKLRKNYPDLKIDVSFDQSKFIKLATGRTKSNAVIGGLLAALMIFLFLLDLRPTLSIALAIPLSIIITFIVLYAAGYTLNMMTLGGIALGVGMLVDASIVVIENIFRHHEQGESPQEAAIKGTEEVWLAISASTFTNLVVFLPLIYVGGIVGKMTKPLAISITSTLLASLFVAVTIMPMITSQFLKIGKKFQGEKEHWFKYFREWYRNILDKIVLRRRGLVIFLTFILLVASLLLVKVIGIEFIPNMDRTFGIITVELPPGTRLAETKSYVEQISKLGAQYPEIEHYAYQVGSMGEEAQGFSLMMGGGGDNSGFVSFVFKDPAKRKRRSYEVINDLLEKIPEYHGAKVKAMDMSKMMFSGANSRSIDIKIFGDEISTLRKIAEDIEKKIDTIKGVANPEISLQEAKPELRIRINRSKAAMYGLVPMQIQNELDIAVGGKKVTKIREGGKEYDLVIKLDSAYVNNDPERILDYPIKTPMGMYIPLKEVADYVYTKGPIRIEREKQSRLVHVYADTRGRSTGRVMRDIEKVLSGYHLPEGYSIEYGGEMEQIKDMVRDMTFAVIAAIFLVYMIMAAQFESLKDPFIVMFSLPLAIIGVIVLFFLTGTTISVPSLIGVLILMGVAVNEAIVMITLIKQLREKGVDDYRAIVDGATIRLRPVLISGFTTIIGMLPMALVSHGHGAEMRQPMAIAMIGGLFSSMILTLFIIPVVYSYFEKIKPPKKA